LPDSLLYNKANVHQMIPKMGVIFSVIALSIGQALCESWIQHLERRGVPPLQVLQNFSKCLEEINKLRHTINLFSYSGSSSQINMHACTLIYMLNSKQIVVNSGKGNQTMAIYRFLF
jgi:hypothetical protein